MKSLRPILHQRVALGFAITYPAPGIIEQLGGDWDWIWIDGQHGSLDYHTQLECVRAAEIVGAAPIIRVSGHDYGEIGRALDTGAAGVIVPMVNTVEEAQQAVKAARFAPLGQRSYGGRRVADLHGRVYSHTADEDTILVVQIESGEAVSNVEAIAAVPGVDVVFYGPDDRALEMGIPMDVPRDPEILAEEYQRVAHAAKQHGKFAGTPGVNPQFMQRLSSMGYRLLNCTADVALLASGSTATRASVDEALKTMTA